MSKRVFPHVSLVWEGARGSGWKEHVQDMQLLTFKDIHKHLREIGENLKNNASALICPRICSYSTKQHPKNVPQAKSM